MVRLKLGLVWGLLLLLTACATRPSVMTDYDTAYDYANLRTFYVAESRQVAEQNLLISPFTIQHLQRVIVDQLGQRYEPVRNRELADFRVRYHIVMEERLDMRSFDQRYGFGYYGFGPFHRLHYGPPPTPRVYNQGSLIVDIVDGRTGQPIWRGVAEERIHDRADPSRQREILSAAMVDILSQFPPVR
ncbi:DUF4136 domain-containing protein [Marinimicrobium sp. ABcell2]|uniref:DUF4136 domain-containing protein n=1 Tax=Marinimicrobium sp. ABcell2 TaxID=3069751 RepID=UPI0027B04F28|nr:DUF4136 domain-containing protein [Marinimicrobium sp. ABcell2]MDQ2075416.1 DUF4136 domain-containing protein [Marinimicrobium sp. ABcell2]